MMLWSGNGVQFRVCQRNRGGLEGGLYRNVDGFDHASWNLCRL